MCRMLGHGLEPGPVEGEEVRRRGLDALLSVVTAANSGLGDSGSGPAVGVRSDLGYAAAATPEVAGAGAAARRRQNEIELFALIDARDMAGIHRICTENPVLIHTVRETDGKTPTIVAAIIHFSAAVWYFVERGAGFKHHSHADVGFSGHHVSELIPCESALDCLAVLGHGNGAGWRPADIVARLVYANAVFTALGETQAWAERVAAVPLPDRRRHIGAAYILHELQGLVDGDGSAANTARSSAEHGLVLAEVSQRCRLLLDLALTYSADVSRVFFEVGGVATFSHILDLTDGDAVLATCRRFHVMALTVLHVCLHVMKAVRGGDTALLDSMLTSRLPRMLMKLARRCIEVADPAATDADPIQMHAQRTSAAAFQSLTEVSFNTFESDWLAVSFPEGELVHLVTTIAMESGSERRRPRRYFLADKACSEMLAWWITNLLDAGLFVSIPRTRVWAKQVAEAILKVILLGPCCVFSPYACACV
jgi:hypothetical protein